MLSEGLPDPSPTFIDGDGKGPKDYENKREPLLSIEQCHATVAISVVSMGIVVINCIRCANCFFSMIADAATGVACL